MSEHILSLSYGKDSLACLGAIDELGWPLDRIVHAEVWATDTIPADLPPMVEFKAKADKIIKARWGLEVDHLRAASTYEECFYAPITKHRKGRECRIGLNRGWPYQMGAWCQRDLKGVVIDRGIKSLIPKQTPVVRYWGIAIDEPNRFGQLSDTLKSPLVAAGWNEARCRKWCAENDLLSPIYTTATRGGCWFCHNQSVGQLRLLRKDYPDLWALMLKWDEDSPVTFKPDGHTVHDYDERFYLEDAGLIRPDERFLWSMLANGGVNYRLF